MKYLFIAVLFLFRLPAISQTGNPDIDKNTKAIKIEWIDNLSGDFSFAKKWEYPEGIYKNDYGQLVCNGLCPDEVYRMMDSTGKIYKDSLKAYYKIVDTSHQFYSIKADAWCYEYAGTNFINCSKDWDTNIIGGYTLDNAATHSSLLFEFDLKLNYCHPIIMLNSISGPITFFQCSSGTIKIDKKSWKKGVLKAVFDFKFINTIDKSKPIFWKGKILSTIGSVGPGC